MFGTSGAFAVGDFGSAMATLRFADLEKENPLPEERKTVCDNIKTKLTLAGMKCILSDELPPATEYNLKPIDVDIVYPTVVPIGGSGSGGDDLQMGHYACIMNA